MKRGQSIYSAQTVKLLKKEAQHGHDILLKLFKKERKKSGTVGAGIMHTGGHSLAQKDKGPLCINYTA